MRRIVSSELQPSEPPPGSGLKLPSLKAGWQSLKDRLGIARASDTPVAHGRRKHDDEESDSDGDDDFNEFKFFGNDTKREAPMVPVRAAKSSSSGDPGVLLLRSGDYGAILEGGQAPKRERFASVSSKALQARANDASLRGNSYGANGLKLSSSPTAVDNVGSMLSPDGALSTSQSFRNGHRANRGAWGDGGGPTTKMPSDTLPMASRRESSNATPSPAATSSGARHISDTWAASSARVHSQPNSTGPRGLTSPASVQHARDPLPSSPGQQLLVVSPALPPLMRRQDWVLEDYDVSRLMARTSSYVMQRATCMHSGLPVCLKTYNILAFSRESFNLLRQEVELQARLVHKHVLKMFGAFVDDGQFVIVYEHAPRGDLAAVMERFRLGAAEVVDVVIRPLLSAIAFVHSRGVCHGNVKGECIMFMQDWRLALTGLSSATNFAPASRSRRHRHEGSESSSSQYQGSGGVRSAGMLPTASRSSRSNMGAAAAAAALLNTAPELAHGSRVGGNGAAATDDGSCHGGGEVDYYSDPDFVVKAAADVAMVGRLTYELLVGCPPAIRLMGVDEDEDANDALDEGSDEGGDGYADDGGAGRRRSRARMASCPEELHFPSSVPPQARRFIRCMLAREALDRPLASDLLRDPWLLATAQTSRRRSSEMRR
ncbi:hypothetical protein HXX76_007917 [Chlamydomonas incerta]|uniref:Protein kinase domain-containing protein n=1 Tax=Chlamydomonas incerta TaxID=51695 RepID=A0A835SYR4_CHLIN|nr:hypothetical protein HXX76_007917 [Chlamydomonas incerta]|eukprot:KAG2434191.1 hypothetical protein HXX76_007917 [Chlamydomonas incerta]